MKLTCGPRYNIAYIRFQEKRGEVEAVRVSDQLTVDMSPDGTVYGIELLNANEQLQREDMGTLAVINEATGERTELPLALASQHERVSTGSRRRYDTDGNLGGT